MKKIMRFALTGFSFLFILTAIASAGDLRSDMDRILERRTDLDKQARSIVEVTTQAMNRLVDEIESKKSKESNIFFAEGMQAIWTGEYLEVTTKENELRIYPCGRVTKKTWEEINKNEEQQQTFMFINPNDWSVTTN